jgi:hypothetical protein
MKAYKNPEFLSSKEARTIRILAEYLEPEKRFNDYKIMHTVVFFGSARIKPDDDKTISQYYWAAEELAFLLASWGKNREKKGKGIYICTGGGPGIMEAANRGAHRANARNIGLNISIPQEQVVNNYISPELNLEFHYFFMRKLWFLYQAKALIFFPGGYGTLDELFESLTLMQTRKLQKWNLPLLLYDRKYWEDLIDFEKLMKYKLISPEDLDLIHFFSDPQEGFDYLKPKIEEIIEDVEHDMSSEQ